MKTKGMYEKARDDGITYLMVALSWAFIDGLRPMALVFVGVAIGELEKARRIKKSMGQ